MNKKQIYSWALYDWANSAFATTVMAGFFPIFFAQYWSNPDNLSVSTFYLGLGNSVASLIVALLSFIIGLIYEEFVIRNIMNEIDSILYAGILSGGFAFVLQIYAQKNITPAPAAIIFSLEGVFATIAAWFLLNQLLGINNLLGCFFILCGVLLSQLLPLMKKTI